MYKREPRDFVDSVCFLWGHQRRVMLGLEKIEPYERIGKMRSTLANLRGGGSTFNVGKQEWPSVYSGRVMLAHRAWHEFDGLWKGVMTAHYVWLELSVESMCPALSIDRSDYYLALGALKSVLDQKFKNEKMSLKSIGLLD